MLNPASDCEECCSNLGELMPSYSQTDVLQHLLMQSSECRVQAQCYATDLPGVPERFILRVNPMFE